MNKIYILKVFKNSINKIVALDINVNGVLKRISIDQLAYLKIEGTILKMLYYVEMVL